MTAALAWLAGTRLGRWLAAAVAGALVALGIIAQVYGAGRRSAESRPTRDSLESLRNRTQVDDEVDRMGAARRRDELARWVQHDGR